MKNYLIPLVALVIISSSNVRAADDKYLLSIDAALTKHNNLVDPNIELYFATQPHGEILENLEAFVSSRTTNARLKSPDTSCSWVFMSAILALQKRAVAEGGNAVVNIHSYYNKIEMFDEQRYECHDGRNVSRVVLKGTVVRLEK